jgi:aldehyde dehydrogenase (NAD+)
MATTTIPALLARLDIKDVNPGACAGPGEWITDPGGRELVSHNPTTGEPIARVVQAGAAAYDQVVSAAVETFHAWRMVPARSAARWCAISATRSAR